MKTYDTERIPAWLRRPVADRVSRGPARRAVAGLNTVCQEARCPNRGRCLGEARTATFLLMGPGCSRDCKFCSVPRGPAPLDAEEPVKVAAAARALDLGYVVLTSTTRDDLADGGARHFVETVAEVKNQVAGADVEVLTPDFAGSGEAVDAVVASGVAVFGHNVETVPRLYGAARPGADYARSLEILARAARIGVITKSALMLGLGETVDELRGVFRDLRSVGVSILAVGQYLRPGERQLPVARFWEPEVFDDLEAAALETGFEAVASAPYVRSSYRAGEIYREVAAARVSRASS
jgi:lipoic acid synthetase